MKRIMAVILAAVMVFSMTACGGEKTYTKDDFAIRDTETGKLIRLGDMREDVEEIVGEPEEEEEIKGREEFSCKYPSGIDIVYNKDGEAIDMSFSKFDYSEEEIKYELAEGVGLGQTEEDIFNAYPEAEKWPDDGLSLNMYSLSVLKNDNDKKYKKNINFNGDWETVKGILMYVACDEDNKIDYISVALTENEE